MQLLALVLASLAASVYAADPLVIDTPAEVVQCEPTVITWSGGTEFSNALHEGRLTKTVDSNPRVTQIIPQVITDNGDIIGDNDLIFGTSYEFSGTAAPAGTTVVFSVSDFSGDGASTAPIVVSNSSDSSCFPPSA
ncbi:hypothetical protein LXA43DRAFT_1098620 [Ganoderma leucocontextum]|nr:hypothetical protein LXA43DRAFT_1098620 [Ganoderma leucocontextum]